MPLSVPAADSSTQQPGEPSGEMPFTKPVPQSSPVTNRESETIIGRYLLLNTRTGRTVTNQDFYGRYQLITFGYTFCPDVCPTTLASLQEALKLLAEDAAKVQVIFITVDPERDSSKVLYAYTEFFDKRMIGLTGSPELIRRVADNFNVRYEKVRDPDAPADQYTIDHSTGTYVLDPDGKFLFKLAYTATPKEIAARIKALIHASAE